MADLRLSSISGTPFGGTADRPSNPLKGQTYFNGDLGCLEIYTGTIWVASSAPPAIPSIGTVSQANSPLTYVATSSVSVPIIPGSGGGLANSYTVLSSPGSITATGTSSPIVVPGLTSGTTYTFTATATNNFNTSSASLTSSAITPATVPSTPTIGTATANYVSGQVSVAFTPSSATGGSTISGYTVTSSPGNITATGSSSPILVTGLTNGTTYTFTVTATNAIGTSASSSVSNSATPISTVSAEILVVAEMQ